MKIMDRDVLEFYSEIEEKFMCSGMCMTSLFYYSLNINDYFMPRESCVHKMIEFVHDEARPYGEACVGACFFNFLMFLLHLTMYN